MYNNIYKTNKKVYYTYPYLVGPIYMCVCTLYIIYINTTSFYMCFADQAMAGEVPVVFSLFLFFFGKQTQLYTRRQVTRFIFGFQYPGLVYFDSDTVHHSVLNFVQYIPLCVIVYTCIYIYTRCHRIKVHINI